MARSPLVCSAAALLLVACGPATDTPDGQDTDSAPIEDTDLPGFTFPNDDDASLILTVTQPGIGAPQGAVDLRAVFVETRRDIFNLAECMANQQDAICFDDLPTTLDSYIKLSKQPQTLWDEIQTRDIGPGVELGPYRAKARNYDDVRVYFALSAGDPPEPGERLDLAIGPGEWGERFIGPEVLTAPDEMVVTSPDVTRRHTFPGSDAIPLRWEPGEGEVYLTLLSTMESRLYRLEDDGAFDLDLAPLNLWDGGEVRLALSRITTERIDVDGHTITAMIRRDQWIVGDYRDVDGVELVPADTCAVAEYMASVGPGTYWGTVESYTNDHNPGSNGCTNFNASGQDGVVPYLVQPWERLGVSLTFSGGDASLYILEECNRTDTCLTGSDRSASGDTETVSWFNNSDEPVQTYIIIDSWGTNSGPFALEISSAVLVPDVLVDTCLEAMEQGPVGPGIYVGDTNFFVNQLDPMGTCGVSAPGGDGLVQVLLLPGQTLEASVDMPGANPSLYVLYNCAIAESCPAGSDANSNSQETVSYQNRTQGSELVYLVVDSSGATGQYELTIDIR